MTAYRKIADGLESAIGLWSQLSDEQRQALVSRSGPESHGAEVREGFRDVSEGWDHLVRGWREELPFRLQVIGLGVTLLGGYVAFITYLFTHAR